MQARVFHFESKTDVSHLCDITKSSNFSFAFYHFQEAKHLSSRIDERDALLQKTAADLVEAKAAIEEHKERALANKTERNALRAAADKLQEEVRALKADIAKKCQVIRAQVQRKKLYVIISRCGLCMFSVRRACELTLEALIYMS